MRSRLTPVNPNAFRICSNAHSLDACRSKCIPDTFKCALARRLSIQMNFGYAQMRSRSTLVDPNAFRIRSNALSPDAYRSKCLSHTLKCALARRLSIQMHSGYVQVCFRSTPIDPNAFRIRSNALSLDACRLSGARRQTALTNPETHTHFRMTPS